MLRKVLPLIICMVLTGASALATVAQDDIAMHRECHQCGMDRKIYGYSRMLILYEDGAQTGVCSLHCTVTEMNEHKDKKVKTVLVADRDSHTLIEADKAFWVMGGKKRGVMTQRPKWAFATGAAAQAFIAANGGAAAGWNEVLSAAREEPR